MNHNGTERGAGLPIYEVEKEILEALPRDRRMLVRAPTGAGKSTQIPQMLVKSGAARGQVLILQPRRLAARMLAARVASEMGTPLGQGVGYQIRFEDRSCRATRIKYVTEGLLLRQMLVDPSLQGVDTLILDEFHERHISSDVCLAMACRLQKTVRPDLKIMVMSATLDIAGIEDYLAPCRTVVSEGRQYPVTIQYLDRAPNPEKTPIWDLTAGELERLLPDHGEGDVLVFMPGAYEISRTIQALRNSPATKGFEILPLHGEIPADRQDAAIARYDRRKIVVSTNVAETSLTIDGITMVIDSGFARIARFDAHRGINTLFVEKISRASADQRTGRAGRVCPGFCLRLWTEKDHAGRPERETPEVKRIDLAETVLSLKAGGVTDLREFPWFEAPGERALERAEMLLADLGALDADGKLTPLGKSLTAFPVHPRYARMLLAANERGCVPAIALVAALTQERSIIIPRQGKQVEEMRDRRIEDNTESDFIALMNAWKYAAQHDFDVGACREVGVHAVTSRTVGKLHDYFMGLARREGMDIERNTEDIEVLAKCVLTGFSDHVACRVSEGSSRCELVRGRRGNLAKESSVRSGKLLVACEVSEIGSQTRDAAVTLRLATTVNPEWLSELFPDDVSEKREAILDDASKRVYLEKHRCFRDLLIERKRSGEPTEEEAAEILAEEVIAGRITLKGWDHSVEQWIHRVNLLASRCPELGVPAFTAADRRSVLERVCHGSFSAKEVKEKPVLPALKGLLSPSQREQVEKEAPERVTLSSGRAAKVMYEAGDAPPYIAQTIQNLYDVRERLSIAMGRVPLLVHILGPNMRPVQVTQDLGGFWRDHYPRVKKELQRRYPKHEWR